MVEQSDKDRRRAERKARSQELLTRLVDGDDTARDKLIENNMGLVKHLVDRYRERFRWEDCDDLIGAGYAALVEGVNGLRKKDVNIDVGKYLWKAIKNAVVRAAATSGLVGPSFETQQRLRRAGTPFIRRKIDRLDTHDPDHRLDEWVAVAKAGDGQEVGPLSLGEQDALEKLLACCRTVNERAFVEMRRQGKRKQDIAAELGVRPATVSAISRRLWERYNEASPSTPLTPASTVAAFSWNAVDPVLMVAV